MTIPASIIARPKIDLAHHRIHEGRFFTVTAIAQGLAAGVPKYFMIVSPPATVSIAHVIVSVSINPGATIEILEGATVTNNGTPLGAVNMDRNNPMIAIGFAFENPTVTSEGTSIFAELVGTTTTGGIGGPRYRNEDEIMFKSLTKYLIKTTPLSDNTYLSIRMKAYRQGVI